MAWFSYKPMKAANPDVVVIHGSFQPDGSSAPKTATQKGLGWSVARTSQALYTVTFSAKYPHLLYATATLGVTTASLAGVQAQIGTWTAASKTLQIELDDAGGSLNADLDTDSDGSVIYFMAVFQNSTQPEN